LRGQRIGDFDHRRGAAPVVIGAVVDVVAIARSAHAQVIVMGGHQHVGIAQRGVGAAQHTHHVVQLH
jgi:hypothetical protein